MRTLTTILLLAIALRGDCQQPDKPKPATTNRHWDGKEYRTTGGLKPMPTAAKERWRKRQQPPQPQPDNHDGWKQADIADKVTAILDQNGYAACNPAAWVQAYSATANRDGQGKPTMSVVDLYSRINGGADTGSDLADAADTFTDQGVCTSATATVWGIVDCKHTGNWEADRAAHRTVEVHFCETLDAIAAELAAGNPVVFGTDVTDHFTPNAEGIIGPRSGRAEGGHAMYAVGLKKIGGEWYFHVANSWSNKWGADGLCWLHESWPMPTTFGAFSIRRIDCKPLQADQCPDGHCQSERQKNEPRWPRNHRGRLRDR